MREEVKREETDETGRMGRLPRVIDRDSQLSREIGPLFAGARILKREELRPLEVLQQRLESLHRAGLEELKIAREEAEGIRRAAREEGRAEGLRAWLEEIGRAKEEYGRLQKEAEKDMVTLAFHIARRIVGHSIEVEPALVRDIVREALTAVRGRRQVLVQVHPEDLELLRRSRQEFARHLDGGTLHFEARTEIDRGGCVILTEAGRVDARLETRLETLRRALLERG